MLQVLSFCDRPPSITITAPSFFGGKQNTLKLSGMFFFNNTQKNVKLNLALVVVLFQRRNEENGSKLNQEIGKGGVGLALATP